MFGDARSKSNGGTALNTVGDIKSFAANHSDSWYMKKALQEAQKAYKKGEVPIGAVIVKSGIIVSKGYNEKELKQDPTAHAEMVAIKKACKKLGTWRLNDCDMYVTLEPCTMCAGALLHARIRNLYIGTADLKAGAVGSIIDVLKVEKFNHRIEVMYGIMEEECSGILKQFFKELRIKKTL